MTTRVMSARERFSPAITDRPLKGPTMLRAFLSAFLLWGVNVAPIAAQEKIATFGPIREFKGYPRNQEVGSKGHTVRGSWFTGRWYCAVITSGVVGELTTFVPFATGKPIRDEHVVAIAAVDSQSETKFCVSIKPEFQPGWKEFHLRIITKDIVCLTARSSPRGDKSKDCSFLTVSLPDKTIDVAQLPVASAKGRLQTLAFDPPSDLKALKADGGLPPNQSTQPPRWTLGNGWGSIDEIAVYAEPEPDPEVFIGPASQGGRVTQFEVIGSGAFAISERDPKPNGRIYWLLSEAAIEARSKEKPEKVDEVYFPRLLIAPVTTLVFATAPRRGPPTLYTISNGRLRKLWDAPAGYSIQPEGLHLSEDESHAAVELSADADTANSDMAVSIKVDSAEVTVFQEQTDLAEYLFVVGVTNRGDLIQENASVADTWQLIRRRDSKNPRKVVRMIREP